MFIVAVAAILIWDWCITLSDEVSLPNYLLFLYNYEGILRSNTSGST